MLYKFSGVVSYYFSIMNLSLWLYKVKIVPSLLGDDAGIIGSAGLVFHNNSFRLAAAVSHQGIYFNG